MNTYAMFHLTHPTREISGEKNTQIRCVWAHISGMRDSTTGVCCVQYNFINKNANVYDTHRVTRSQLHINRKSHINSSTYHIMYRLNTSDISSDIAHRKPDQSMWVMRHTHHSSNMILLYICVYIKLLSTCILSTNVASVDTCTELWVDTLIHPASHIRHPPTFVRRDINRRQQSPTLCSRGLFTVAACVYEYTYNPSAGFQPEWIRSKHIISNTLERNNERGSIISRRILIAFIITSDDVVKCKQIRAKTRARRVEQCGARGHSSCVRLTALPESRIEIPNKITHTLAARVGKCAHIICIWETWARAVREWCLFIRNIHPISR